MYYDGSKFAFEAKQSEYHGNDSESNIAWSAHQSNYGMVTSSKAYGGNFLDWDKVIGDGKTWCTLTQDEWTVPKIAFFRTKWLRMPVWHQIKPVLVRKVVNDSLK